MPFLVGKFRCFEKVCFSGRGNMAGDGRPTLEWRIAGWKERDGGVSEVFYSEINGKRSRIIQDIVPSDSIPSFGSCVSPDLPPIKIDEPFSIPKAFLRNNSVFGWEGKGENQGKSLRSIKAWRYRDDKNGKFIRSYFSLKGIWLLASAER